MAKPNTTASDILSLKNVRPTIQRMILEEQWKVRIAKAIHERRDKAGLSIKN